VDKVLLNSLCTLPLATVIDKLAARCPAPAGVSAAALTGSQAAALVTMVMRIALAKQVAAEPNAPAGESLDQALEIVEASRRHLLALADDDMAAYNAVSVALAMPKTTPAEHTARALAVQQALKGAAATPYAVAEESMKIMAMIEPAAALASRMVASDVVTALYLADACCRSALLAVRVNLGALRDEEFVAGWSTRINQLEQKRAAVYATAQLACEAALGLDLYAL
jgi:formiminotetrahydrofolate cyclodeaminase